MFVLISKLWLHELIGSPLHACGLVQEIIFSVPCIGIVLPLVS